MKRAVFALVLVVSSARAQTLTLEVGDRGQARIEITPAGEVSVVPELLPHWSDRAPGLRQTRAFTYRPMAPSALVFGPLDAERLIPIDDRVFLAARCRNGETILQEIKFTIGRPLTVREFNVLCGAIPVGAILLDALRDSRLSAAHVALGAAYAVVAAWLTLASRSAITNLPSHVLGMKTPWRVDQIIFDPSGRPVDVRISGGVGLLSEAIRRRPCEDILLDASRLR